MCASWPKEYGGKGLSTMEAVVLAEEFQHGRRADARRTSSATRSVGPTILQWGTEEQKQEFIPKILRGEIAWCQGFSEPDAGSDLGSLKTTAVLDGDEWVINGQKIWTTQGFEADYIFVLCRTDPDGAQAQGHLVPAVPDAPARRRGAAASASPTAAASSARCSSPTRGARSTTSSAASTTGGRSR